MLDSSPGSRIRDFRHALGLTQAALAEQLDISPITVLRWENGTSKPSTLAAKALEALGMGALERHETKAVSVSRAADTGATELRAAVRPTLNVDGMDVEFDPSPFVINGPEDQLQFYEQLYELQEEPLRKGLLSPERLTLVDCIPALGVRPSQAALERPKAGASAWNSNYGTHGWHRYVGRFPPHLVRGLLNNFELRAGDRVCDPFLGSGTTLVEARLLGLRGLGLEVCPLSTMISRAKTGFPDTESELAELEALLPSLSDFYRERWDGLVGDSADLTHDRVLGRPGNPVLPFANVEKWFTPEAFLGTTIVVEFCLGLDGYAQQLVATCLSAQMRSIGNVDVDVVRAEYRKTPRVNVDVLQLVLRKLKSAIASIRSSLLTHAETIGPRGDIEVIEKSVLGADVSPGSVAAIITSPPYGVESLSYLRTHLLSYRTLEPLIQHDVYGWNRDVIGSEFVHTGPIPDAAHKAATRSATYRRFFANVPKAASPNERKRTLMMMQFFDDMSDTSDRMASWLRPGGRLAFVVGNKRLGEQVIPTHEIMQEVFATSGLRVDRVVAQKLKTNNSNSEVPWQERIIQEENILLCTKVGHAAS